MKTLFITLLALTIILALSSILVAQSPPPFPTGPSQAPIDGGLGLLAAAGGVYAWRKLRAAKKE